MYLSSRSLGVCNGMLWWMVLQRNTDLNQCERCFHSAGPQLTDHCDFYSSDASPARCWADIMADPLALQTFTRPERLAILPRPFQAEADRHRVANPRATLGSCRRNPTLVQETSAQGEERIDSRPAPVDARPEQTWRSRGDFDSDVDCTSLDAITHCRSYVFYILFT